MSFNCSGCGCCCRRIKTAVESVKHIDVLSFPYSWDDSGKCEMLGEDNKCKVYDERPLICNVDKLMTFFKYPEEEFYSLNRKSCNEMMDIDNVPQLYRI